MGPMRPVQALCDLGETIESTVTQINNTHYIDVDVSTKSGFNKVDINYLASITQMRELIMNSGSCKQFIKFSCKGAPLFRSPTGPPQVIILFFFIFFVHGHKHEQNFKVLFLRGHLYTFLLF